MACSASTVGVLLLVKRRTSVRLSKRCCPRSARPVEHLINDNTLVALALLVAESLPDQKTLMIRLIEHFILLAKEDGDA